VIRRNPESLILMGNVFVYPSLGLISSKLTYVVEMTWPFEVCKTSSRTDSQRTGENLYSPITYCSGNVSCGGIINRVWHLASEMRLNGAAKSSAGGRRGSEIWGQSSSSNETMENRSKSGTMLPSKPPLGSSPWNLLFLFQYLFRHLQTATVAAPRPRNLTLMTADI
jgi:hypothetical protein